MVIFPLKMVISNSYVSLPEGNLDGDFQPLILSQSSQSQ